MQLFSREQKTILKGCSYGQLAKNYAAKRKSAQNIRAIINKKRIKLHKKFVGRSLAIFLCLAIIFCTIPLRNGNHISGATDGEPSSSESQGYIWVSDAPLTESSSNSDTFTIKSFPFTLYVGASSSAETYTPLSDVSFHNYSSSGCDYNLDLASGLITVTSALNRSAIGIAATKEGWTFSSFLIWLSCPWSAATGLECDTFGAVTSVYGAAQLFCVSDLNSALPAGTTLSVKAVS